MKKSPTREFFKRLATCMMMVVALSLWGYLIGSYLQLYRNIKQGPMHTSQLLQQQRNLLEMSPAARLGRSIYPTYPDHSPSLKELSKLTHDYERFLSRDDSFEARLTYDRQFALENSF